MEMEDLMQEEMIEQLNRQINLEFFSAYFYLDVANYYTCLLYTSAPGFQYVPEHDRL